MYWNYVWFEILNSKDGLLYDVFSGYNAPYQVQRLTCKAM